MRRLTTVWPPSWDVSRHENGRPLPSSLEIWIGEPISLLAENRGIPVKYMLMFCDRPHDSEFDDGLVGKYLALQEEAERNGTFVTGAPLQGAGSGARVRVADGETVVTDGPFAEATDLLSGFFIIDVPTREEAIAFAARVPAAERGVVEVRPIWDHG